MRKFGKSLSLWVLVLLPLVVLSISCTGGKGLRGPAPAIFENAKAMVADAKTRITQISVADLKVRIDKGDKFLLLDVREPKEFKADNIPGSINLARGLLEFKIADKKFWEGKVMPAKTDEIILYCKKGGRGVLATEALKKLGYKNVKNLDSGWLGWKEGPKEGTKEEEDDGGCGG